MDKTLKRPLFKQKAMEAYKAKHGGKVPGYVIGAPVVIGARALAAPAFRFLSRTLPNYFVKKAPGITGAAELGVSAPFAAEGVMDVGEGLYTGDYGQVLQGLGETALGGIGALRGTRILGMSKPLRDKAFVKGAKDTAKFIEQKYVPKGTGLAGLAAFGTGSLFAGPDQTQEQAQAESQEESEVDIQDKLIFTKPVYSESFSGAEQPSLVEGPRAVGVKNPQTEGEKTLDNQLKTQEQIYQVAKDLGITNRDQLTDQKIKQIAIESNIDETTVREYVGKPAEATPPPAPKDPVASTQDVTNAIPGMTNDEVDNLVKNRQRTIQEADSLSGLNNEFRQFKEQLAKMTGTDNNNLNNLVAMKVASTLLTGKTNQRGFAGFLDVAGQGLGTAADSLMALKLAQQEQDMQLAQAFLKSKAEKETSPGFEPGDKIFKIEDPNFPGNYYNVKGLTGKDGRQYYRSSNNEVLPVPAGAVGYQTPENVDKKNLYSSMLEENKRGQDMIQTVIDILPKEGPLNAAFGLVKEDVYGTLEQAIGRSSFSKGGNYDAEIRRLIGNNTDEKERSALLEKYNDEVDQIEKRAKQIAKEAEGGGVFSRISDEQLEKYTKLALIEQRMKYLVANQNKSEDRLTQRDIDNAEKLTKTIMFVGSARSVAQNYERLLDEFKAKAQSLAMQYRGAGGTESSMRYFIDTVPGVKEMYEEKFNKMLQQQKISNKQSRNEIISGIQIPGA